MAFLLRAFCATVLLGFLAAMPKAAEAQPAFSQAFSPNTIGPNGTSALIFTIDNGSGDTSLTDLAFTSVLPAGVTLANPSNATSTCSDGTLGAPNGGNTITYSGGRLPLASVCTVSVNVTASASGNYSNASVILTSSEESSSSLAADLTVSFDAPGFSKTFAPSTIPLGGRSTMTYTIDNTANSTTLTSLSFSESLPSGVTIASPANAVTNCGEANTTSTFTATSGSSEIVFSIFGFGFPGSEALLAGSFCTITVDVTGTSVGVANAVSGALTYGAGGPTSSAGTASATLSVTGAGAGSLQVSKAFTDDPVGAGGQATLEFTVQNTSRSGEATAISFTDDLGAMLAGSTASLPAQPDPPCGPGSALSGSGVLSLTGGTLAPESSCTFSVMVNVPGGTSTGAYTNVTSAVTGVIEGAGVTGSAAQDQLNVTQSMPLGFAKSFAPGAVAAGSDVTLSYTITNSNIGSAASDISFTDEMTAFLPFPVSAILPAVGACGTGSSVTLVSPNLDQQSVLLTGGAIPAGGSCTFDVTLTVPGNVAGGTFNSTSDPLSAVIEGETVTSPGASASFTVNAGVNLSFNKVFAASTAVAGETIQLDFTISSAAESTADATGVTFSDDLEAMLTGTVATGLPLANVCGDGTLSGTNELTLSGATLSPGENCTFSVTVAVPAGAVAGEYTNTTSPLTGSSVAGPVAVGAASDTLQVFASDALPVLLSQEFIGGPFLPGQTGVLRYTIENPNVTSAASDIFFTHSLSTALSGLATQAPLPAAPCGASSSVTGPSFVIFVGGDLAPGTTCSFDVTVLIPAGADSGSTNSVTSQPNATVGGSTQLGEAATALLVVESAQLLFSKSFGTNPVEAGTSTTLEFTLENPTSSEVTALAFTDDLSGMLSGAQAASSISNTCNGMAAGLPAGLFDYSGGTLAAGTSCTIEIAVDIPAAALSGAYLNTTSALIGTAGGLAISGDAANDTLRVQSADSPDFSKAFSAASVVAGDTVDLTFTVQNNRAGATLVDLQFTDDLGAMLSGAVATNTPVSACGGTLSGTGQLSFVNGDLAAMGSCDITVTVQIPNTAAGGSYTNTSSALTESGLSVSAPASANLSVTEEADLSITLSDAPDPIFPTQTLTYTVEVSNAGPSVASAPRSVFDLPAGLTFVSSTGCLGDPGGVPNCALGDIPAGSSASYTVTATVDAATTGTLNASATVSGMTPDPDNSNDTATAQTVVTPQADISVTKSDGITSIRAGGIVTYTIDVANAGPSADMQVLVSDTFPSNLSCTYTSAAQGGAQGNTPSGTGNLTDTLGMPAGSRVTYEAACLVAADATGTLSNTVTATGSVNDPALGNNTATDNDTVVTPPVLVFTKAFGPAGISQGQISTLTFTIDNSNNLLVGDNLTFADTFPAGMQVAPVPNVTNNCGGTLSATAAAPSISFASGTVAPETSCTISVDVRALTGGTLTNTSDPLTSTLPTAAGASATLTVTPAQSPGFAKVFAPAAVNQGQQSTITFTVENTGNSIEATDMAFTDPLPSGLLVADAPNVVSDCGGAFTANAGDASMSLTGGTVAALSQCTISVDVVALGAGQLTNTTSALTSSLPEAAAASAELMINPAGAPNFTKLFAPDTVDQGQISTITFTVDNSANNIDAVDLAFADPLPAGILVADAPNVISDCGGTFTATAGEASMTLAGGTVAALSQCTVSVDVVALGDAPVTNTTSALTSSLPEAGAASAVLTINGAGAPVFGKAFTPDAVDQGQQSTLSFTIDNTANSIEAADLSFDDPLPAGLQMAEVPNITNTCGGAFTANAGETMISLTGGTVAAGAECALTVDVLALGEGELSNTTSALSSTLPQAGAASAVLTVTAASAPVFVQSFTPDAVDQGQQSTLSFTIDNAANSIDAEDLTFDNTFPAGLFVADIPNVVSDCGGAFTANAGETVISLMGGTLPAETSCTISVDVQALGDGELTNTSSVLTSSLAQAPAASATLTVATATAPDFAISFSPATIGQGESTVLSVSIDNTANSVEALDLAFDNTLPAGVQVATGGVLSNSCGGSVTAAAGSSGLSLTGGLLAPEAGCAIDISVQGLIAGTVTNTTSPLTSSLADASPASATLTIVAQPLTASLVFTPDTIDQFRSTALRYTLTNNTAVTATNITINDTLPAGVVFFDPPGPSTTCTGGVLSAPNNGDTLSYTGGSLAPGSSCIVLVTVQSEMVGSYTNTTETVSSSLGVSTPASATLTVEANRSGTLTIVQETDVDGSFVFSSAELALNFSIATHDGRGEYGPVTLAIGSYSLTQVAPDGVGNTALSCTDDNSSGDAREGTLTVNISAMENVTCTFTAVSSRQKTVDTINSFLTKRADLILSSEPSNGRRIDRLNRGSGGSSALSFSNGDLQSFLPFTAQISTASESYSMSTSLLQMRQAAASMALAHGDLDGTRYVPNYRWDAWMEAQYKKFDSGNDSGHFAIAYFGADYLVTPDLLIGAVLQIDTMEDDNASLSTSVSGTGFMVGPYMTARLAPNLYFDGRVAAGRSVNDISPFNTYVDEFSTDRWMAMAGLTGEFKRGAWTIQPGASLSYFEEKQNAYIDGIGVLIPGQTVSLGQIKIGPSFTGQFETVDGMRYAPFFSFDALYNFGDTSGVTITNTDTASTDGWRGRVQAGVDFSLENGAQISIGGSYDGIGRGSLDVWGASLEINIPVQKAKAK